MIADWLARLDNALAAGDVEGAAALFHEGGAWRDLLAFTWTIRTMEGPGAIAAMLHATLPHVRPHGFRPDPAGDGADFTFQTATAHGRGRLTLRDGRAQALLTAIADLKGHEERLGATRPQGLTHQADRSRTTWSEARAARRARLGAEDQPHTLIIGGGQGGLALAARLKSLDVPALIVEKNPRAGDSWRNRYRSLVLHDPVWYDHLPYLPFPPNWPVFCPKDKMGDWLEAYALALDLDLWTSSTVETALREGDHWRVTVRRPDGTVTLTPRELVFATGAYGPPRRPDWPGADRFAGTLLHSADYSGGAPFAGRRAVVVGAGSSAHDVAVDLWEAGAEVTMIQRRPTIIIRSESLMEHGFTTYSEAAVAAGIDVDTADWRAAATPWRQAEEGARRLTATIREIDADYYAALARAGFAFDFGEDGTGLMMRAMRTASGYYIDVGAGDLVARGEIGVVSGQGVAGLTETGVRLDDGRDLPADVVVACTGYQSMNEAVAGIVSREAADAVGPCWGLGSGITGDPGPWLGELRNMWKPTAVEGLWFHGGNLALSRFYSRFVALQLKARAEGIPTPVYGAPDGPAGA